MSAEGGVGVGHTMCQFHRVGGSRAKTKPGGSTGKDGAVGFHPHFFFCDFFCCCFVFFCKVTFFAGVVGGPVDDYGHTAQLMQ